MEALFSEQLDLFNQMKQIKSNFGKDSKERKTSIYLEARLSSLDNLWKKFYDNHVTLGNYKSEHQDEEYFVNSVYDKVREYYQELRNTLSSFNAFGGKATAAALASTSRNTEQEPTTPASRLESNQVSHFNSSKLEELKRQLSSYIKAFKRLVDNIDLSIVEKKWELDDLMASVKSRWQAIDELYWQIDAISDIKLDQTLEMQYSFYENEFSEIKKAINEKLWGNVHQERNCPKLEIPAFSGKYSDWSSFYNLFQETIDKNTALSKVQKLQFLKSKLSGEAARLIQHLQISSDNYEIAWEIISHRYNNARLLLSNHLNLLIDQPTIQQASATNLKRMHDVTLESINAINNMGVDTTSWDCIVVHILCQKLDHETYNSYIDSLKNPRDLPIFEEFMLFLERKFMAFETSAEKFSKKNDSSTTKWNDFSTTKNSKSKVQSFQSKAFVRKTAQQTNETLCSFCKKAHSIYDCIKFNNMSPDEKLKAINDLKLCRNCLYQHKFSSCHSEKRCKICLQQHHTLIHDAFNTSLSNHVAQQSPEVLLSTVLLTVKKGDGTRVILRALVDSGSQISLIKESAAQALSLPRQKIDAHISGIGKGGDVCKGMLRLECQSLYEDFDFTIQAHIIKKLINNLPASTFDVTNWPHLQHLQLADPRFNISRSVDMLLGADVYSIIVGSKVLQSNTNLPTLQQTHLGWILFGKITPSYQCNVVINNTKNIERFWSIEDIRSDDQNHLSVEEEYCEKYYNETTIRLPNGRFQVRIPMKKNFKEKLGESKKIALANFFQAEQRIRKNKHYGEKYRAFMQEYIDLNHMKISDKNDEHNFYLPHHGVFKRDSEKIRVVFNASQKTTSGLSLNDVMASGPNLQGDLFTIILQWRKYKYAFTADIEQMYRQILVHPQDQSLQKVLWRCSSNVPIQEYKMLRVTYGLKAAAYLSLKTLKQLASEEKASFPEAAEVLNSQFYVDDVLCGEHNIQKARKLKHDLHALLKRGGFNLTKWASNCQEILEKDQHQQAYQRVFDFKDSETTNTLGLAWNPNTDYFVFKNSISSKRDVDTLTKRALLSNLSKIFDPIGWLSPVTIRAKMLFQDMWSANIRWDDVISDTTKQKWLQLQSDYKQISDVKVPRWISTSGNKNIELHGFCDASMKAFAACVFIRTNTTSDNKVEVKLLAAKTRVSPINKNISLPRLELCGALLLVELMKKINKALEGYDITMYAWSDSQIVLAWLKRDPSHWKSFVANRVEKIILFMPASCWRYVKSEENAADCATRGLTTQQLLEHSLWWTGPPWLHEKEIQVEQPEIDQSVSIEQKKVKCLIIQTHNDIIINLLNKSNTFNFIVRILAWVLHYMQNLQKTRKSRSPYLSAECINRSRYIFIKHAQAIDFSDEIKKLCLKKEISFKSKIYNLRPYLDDEGILRIGGRLGKSDLPTNKKHPILLAHSGKLTELIIQHSHLATLHGGVKLTLYHIRNKYWIVGGVNAVKKQLRNCVICRRHSPILSKQLMAEMPEFRIKPTRPFQHVGIDYSGFYELKINKGRGVKTCKGYVAVFVCMSTKAVHLELSSDLSTATFLASLRRFCARRGAPQHIYSDNGTNFIGAEKELKQQFKQFETFMSKDFYQNVQNLEIEWHFTAPTWASAGGIYEAAVKSMKYHLKRVIGQQKLTFEEFSTVLAQIEACLNSRPLWPLTEDTEDLNCLTPGHFLIGSSILAPPEGIEISNMPRRWQLTQRIQQDFWKAWSNEYLHNLQARAKWLQPQKNMEIGSLVTIHNDFLPPGRWALGRVKQVHPGSDGRVRVVTLKTQNGDLKRPIIKLSPLPVPNNNAQV